MPQTPTPTPSPTIVVDLVSSGSAPWWGVPVIAGIFLMAGAVLGFLFNQSIERKKVLREDQIRWHNVVRELAAEVLVLGDNLAWSGRNLNSMRVDGKDPEGASLPVYVKELQNFVDNLQHMFSKANELNLLVPSSVGDPLFLFTYVSRDTQKVPQDDEERELIRKAHKKFKDDFLAAVRSYLEINTDSTRRAP